MLDIQLKIQTDRAMSWKHNDYTIRSKEVSLQLICFKKEMKASQNEFMSLYTQ